MSRDPFEDAFTTGNFGEQHHSGEKQVDVHALPHGLRGFSWGNQAEGNKRNCARNSPDVLADAEESCENACEGGDADRPDCRVPYDASPENAANATHP